MMTPTTPRDSELDGQPRTFGGWEVFGLILLSFVLAAPGLFYAFGEALNFGLGFGPPTRSRQEAALLGALLGVPAALPSFVAFWRTRSLGWAWAGIAMFLATAAICGLLLVQT